MFLMPGVLVSSSDLRRKLLTEPESPDTSPGWLQQPADTHCRLSPAQYWPLIGRAVLISASDWLLVSLYHPDWAPHTLGAAGRQIQRQRVE